MKQLWQHLAKEKFGVVCWDPSFLGQNRHLKSTIQQHGKGNGLFSGWVCGPGNFLNLQFLGPNPNNHDLGGKNIFWLCPDWSLPMSKVFVNLRDDKIRWLKGNFRHSFFLCQDYFQKILLPLANETPISKGKNSINLREYFQHLTFSCEFNN